MFSIELALAKKKQQHTKFDISVERGKKKILNSHTMKRLIDVNHAQFKWFNTHGTNNALDTLIETCFAFHS